MRKIHENAKIKCYSSNGNMSKRNKSLNLRSYKSKIKPQKLAKLKT